MLLNQLLKELRNLKMEAEIVGPNRLHLLYKHKYYGGKANKSLSRKIL
jgi:hypothetical protein